MIVDERYQAAEALFKEIKEQYPRGRVGRDWAESLNLMTLPLCSVILARW